MGFVIHRSMVIIKIIIKQFLFKHFRAVKVSSVDILTVKCLLDNEPLQLLCLLTNCFENVWLYRRYLAYNLAPVAGVAAHISRNGLPVDIHPSNIFMSPLPLSSTVYVPVTVVGSFLVQHNRGRYLFRCQDSKSVLEVKTDAGRQLIEAWNRELMSCVCDSYVKLILEMQKLRKDPVTSVLDPKLGYSVSVILSAYKDDIYLFWPKSSRNCSVKQPIASGDSNLVPSLQADWECLIEQVIRPFYAHLVELPVWQVYSGNLVKAADGMFLSQPGSGVGENLLPASVYAFVKEHYPVFSVPWELVTEIQAVGIAIKKIEPKMVRDLVRTSSPAIVSLSIDTYIDVLEYCLSDIQLLESSRSGGHQTSRNLNNSDLDDSHSITMSGVNRRHGMPYPSANSGDAIEMMTSLGKALFDFGRGVVGEMGKTGGSSSQISSLTGSTTYGSYGINTVEDLKFLHISSEIKGLPCPTAKCSLIKLGFSEILVANKDEQSLIVSFAEKFIHPDVLERQVLRSIFSDDSIQSLLKLRPFSLRLLANNMRFVFDESWANHVMYSKNAPWFSWEKTSISGSETGPSDKWIKLFWKIYSSSSEDISLFSDWPLIPAFLGRPILCRVRESRLVFFPPSIRLLKIVGDTSEIGISDDIQSYSEACQVQSYFLSYKYIEEKYPWLFSFLNQCNIPVFDATYLECAPPSNCLPAEGQSLGIIIASKLVAAKQAGYLPQLMPFSSSDRDELFSLLASDFSSFSSGYGREELAVLRDLPIYKTVLGTYTQLGSGDICMISSNTFLKPSDDRCLSHSPNSTESYLLRALGIPELHDQQILVKFGLPGFEHKPPIEQEDIMIYLYTNWNDLQSESSVIEVLKETNFVKTADEQSEYLCKPKDLFDPGDTLLTSVFSGVSKKFPGERFISDGWLLILRKTGLRTSTEADVILECAKRVEHLGGESMKLDEVLDEVSVWNSQNEVSFEIWMMAEILVKTILSNFAILYGNNFCNILGKIACVPAEKGFPNIGGRRSGKRVLCSYSESIVMKDWTLAWSCSPILSIQGVLPPEYAWGPLHLCSPPPFSTVLKHLQV